MPEKTLFKKIIDHEISADIVYEDDQCLAFRDIQPQAPTHILVIPKQEIASVDQIGALDKELIGHLFTVMRQLARQEKLDDGYRITVNCGRAAGQSVDHLHFHLMGGRVLTWPPG